MTLGPLRLVIALHDGAARRIGKHHAAAVRAEGDAGGGGHRRQRQAAQAIALRILVEAADRALVLPGVGGAEHEIAVAVGAAVADAGARLRRIDGDQHLACNGRLAWPGCGSSTMPRRLPNPSSKRPEVQQAITQALSSMRTPAWRAAAMRTAGCRPDPPTPALRRRVPAQRATGLPDPD
jgi:hypothetical protein